MSLSSPPKTAAAAEDVPVLLKLVAQNGAETFMKVRRNTKWLKIKMAFAVQQKLDEHAHRSFRLHHDGIRVDHAEARVGELPEDALEEAERGEAVRIDWHQRQMGGGVQGGV